MYIVAAELAAQVAEACKLGPTKELARFKGAALDRVTFQHPFLERSILGVLATYVTADTGTGAVHTAPSHGADDFYTGQTLRPRPHQPRRCRRAHPRRSRGLAACQAAGLRRHESVEGESGHRRHARRARRADGRRSA